MNQLQSTMLVRHYQTYDQQIMLIRSLIISNQPAFSVTRQRSTPNECHWSVLSYAPVYITDCGSPVSVPPPELETLYTDSGGLPLY